MDKKKGGRPKKEFDEKDWKILENAILFGNEDYCANQLNISKSTLELRLKDANEGTFKEFKNKKREAMRVNLAMKQYQVAMSGNVSMLIWLGKNLLNQSDKNENEEISNKPIQVEIIKS